MRSRLELAWNDFWFRPASRHGIVAARIIVSLQALWIVLSRPDLPGILGWPPAFWSHVDPALQARFLMVPMPLAVERALYIGLALCLAATALGLRPRMFAFAAAILIYHFAPFEDVFSSQGGPFFRGLTVSVTALLILAFAADASPRRPVSSEYRWPLALIRLLFAFTYLFSGLFKLVSVGPAWFTSANFEGLVLGLCFPTVRPPWAEAFLNRPFLCALGAAGGALMDFGTVAAVFSRRASRVVVPCLILAHFLIVKVMGVVFLAAPLVLLLVEWDELGLRNREPAQAPPAPASVGEIRSLG